MKLKKNLKWKKFNRNFHDKASKDGLECLSVSVMVEWFCFKLGRNYYSQNFPEECKYKIKEQVLKSFIDEDVENSDDDDDDSKE